MNRWHTAGVLLAAALTAACAPARTVPSTGAAGAGGTLIAPDRGSVRPGDVAAPEGIYPAVCYLEVCDGACVDILGDPDHCGSCGARCAAGFACVAGSCSCPHPLTDCRGMCVDLASDPTSCGSCGVRCALYEACIAGRCHDYPNCQSVRWRNRDYPLCQAQVTWHDARAACHTAGMHLLTIDDGCCSASCHAANVDVTGLVISYGSQVTLRVQTRR